MTDRLRQRAQRFTQIVWAPAADQLFGFSMRFLPQWKGLGEQSTAGTGNRQPPAALIFLVDRNLYQPAAFEWFEIGGKGRAVHGKQVRNAADTGWLRPIERHQQRKLPMREIERAEH